MTKPSTSEKNSVFIYSITIIALLAIGYTIFDKFSRSNIVSETELKDYHKRERNLLDSIEKHIDSLQVQSREDSTLINIYANAEVSYLKILSTYNLTDKKSRRAFDKYITDTNKLIWTLERDIEDHLNIDLRIPKHRNN